MKKQMTKNIKKAMILFWAVICILGIKGNVYAQDIKLVREVKQAAEKIRECQYITDSKIAEIDLGQGSVTIQVNLDSTLFYKILGETTGIEIVNESDLLPILMELNKIKKEYEKIKPALDEVEATGYGIVMPDIDELSLEEPEIIKQGY